MEGSSASCAMPPGIRSGGVPCTHNAGLQQQQQQQQPLNPLPGASATLELAAAPLITCSRCCVDACTDASRRLVTWRCCVVLCFPWRSSLCTQHAWQA